MKKVLTILICIALLLAIAPVAVFAAEEQIVADATTTFVTDDEAFDGDLITFRAIADGTVSVQIAECSPGYYVEIYEGSNWLADYSGAEATQLVLNVSSGMVYELIISTYDVEEEIQVAGSITYQVLSAVVTTDLTTDQPETPSDEKGSSESNPLEMGEQHSVYIDAGQTMWFSYENTFDNVILLSVNGRTTYVLGYQENEITADQDGYINCTFEASENYLFSITNSGTYKTYFTIKFSERADYVNTGVKLSLGANALELDQDTETSLFEFTPSETGEYRFSVDNGVVGNWGTAFNPVDNTEQKENSLTWTCTSVGQSVMVGVSGVSSAVMTVERIGDYVPPVEVPWQYYEYTYDFSYEIPFDAEIVDIDVMDSVADVAVLDSNGFYRYGSANGPLMVADLSNVEINVLDAYNYGQLRAYIYDANGNVTSRIDYNDAMYEYALYGLTPLTEELATMIKQVGDTQSWWKAGGFVFGETAPKDESSAWMAFCSYIKGSELHDGENSVTGSDQHTNPSGGSGKNPGTSDISLVALICIMSVSAVGVMLLLRDKKRFLA